MSVTLNKLIYDISNIWSGGVQSDDQPISDRQVEWWINSARSLLIRRDLEKKRTVSQNILQSLGCLELEPVDSTTCCATVPAGCNILRTVQTIPQPIELGHKDLIHRVGPTDLTARAFSYIPYTRSAFVGHNRFTKNNIRAYLLDNYMYVITPDELLEYINVMGVFEDPTEVAAYNYCNGDSCYTNDSEYPISAWMISAIKKIIVEDNFKILVSTPQDESNNSKDDVELTR